MTPPESGKEAKESDDRSRTYSRVKTKQRQQTTANSYASPYWDQYGYGVKDAYGYGQKYEEPSYDREREAGYIQSEYYYPTMRETGWGCEPSYGSSKPGYKRALEDPSLALAVLVAGALASYLLYTAITDAGIGRKRSTEIIDSPETFQDWFWSGLEEFEEKIDKIAEGQDGGDDNWISKIYHQFSFFNDVDNQLSESDMDGLEPPILDETWGLGVRNGSIKNITANATIGEPIRIDDETSSRNKRAVDEDVEQDEEIEDTEEKCRVDMWRCLSKVIEGGLHYIDDPDGLMGFAKKTMFKIAFHGGFSNVWSGVMTIPEARHIKQCMNSHSECVSYEILRREAQETMDPSDPAYEMYNKKRVPKVKEEEQEGKIEKKLKKERLIINPEFVESLDKGDGSVQYDEDYKVEDNDI